MTSTNIESMYMDDYNTNSFVVRGDTKLYKDQLKELGGKWNPNLVGGNGWVFSIKKKDIISKFILDPVVSKAPEQKTSEQKETVDYVAQFKTINEKLDAIQRDFALSLKILQNLNK